MVNKIFLDLNSDIFDKYITFINNDIFVLVIDNMIYHERFIEDKFYGIKLKIEKNE